MKVTAFELWLIRNDPEIQEASKREVAGILLLTLFGAPMGGVMLVPHKNRCVSLTGRDDKPCVCATVADDEPTVLPAVEGGWE